MLRPLALFTLPLAVTFAIVLGVSRGVAEDSRPNVVFIISDDHDYEHLGFMGGEVAPTPRIDSLAEGGAVFTTAHLPMSRCHPTLASFLSGQWPHQTGIYYNFGSEPLAPTNSLPNLLKDAGYATYVDGKYWEGAPRQMGFTHGPGKDTSLVRNGQQRVFDFLDEVAGERPFFLWWAPLLPHTPHNPPQRLLEKFPADKVPVPDWYTGDVEAFRRKERVSYAMEAWLDEGVVGLMDKLHEKGVERNTLIVFLIDNGWCNGLVSKGSPFEKGVRTPVYFTWPGKIDAGRFDFLVSTLDVYPTILDYAGVEVPKSAAGHSLRPAIEGGKYTPREELFGAIYPAFVTKGDERAERDVYALYARTPEWKYILYTQDVRQKRNGDYFRIQSILTKYPGRDSGDEDLYDLGRDPHELNDLADAPEHAERLADFKRRALRWWSETGGKPIPALQARRASE